MHGKQKASCIECRKIQRERVDIESDLEEEEEEIPLPPPRAREAEDVQGEDMLEDAMDHAQGGLVGADPDIRYPDLQEDREADEAMGMEARIGLRVAMLLKKWLNE